MQQKRYITELMMYWKGWGKERMYWGLFWEMGRWPEDISKLVWWGGLRCHKGNFELGYAGGRQNRMGCGTGDGSTERKADSSRVSGNPY